MDSVSISARMHVTDVDSHEGSDSITMEPVISDDPNDPNSSFSKYTPSGKLELDVTNPALIGQVKPGQVYDILMTPYEPAAVSADDTGTDGGSDADAAEADTEADSDTDTDSGSDTDASSSDDTDAAASDATDADSASSDTSSTEAVAETAA